jgi:hypothetical protein
LLDSEHPRGNPIRARLRRLRSLRGARPSRRTTEWRNEEVASWDEVSVASDDRTLTLKRIQHPPWARSSGTWWATAGTEVEASDEAVSVRVVLAEQSARGPDALAFDDRSREVRVVLDEPLGGRPVVDGCAKLVAPRRGGPDASAELRRYHKVMKADVRTLIVYWHGGSHVPLHHISMEWRPEALVVGVWLDGGTGTAVPEGEYLAVAAEGQYQAAIVQLDRPLGRLMVLDRARTPSP